MLTREEMVYYNTLNLFGSDVEPPEIQAIIDKEHVAAEPEFGEMLQLRQALARAKSHKFVTGLNAAWGHFDTPVEQQLYDLAATTWNLLQDLIEKTEAATK